MRIDRTSARHLRAAFPPARLWLIALVLFSLVLRLLWWYVGPRVIETEGILYARTGENLAHGRGLVAISEMGLNLLDPPLYASLIAAGVRLGLSSELAGRAVSVFAGALLPLAAYLLAKRLYGSVAGWLTGLLVAVHPLLIVTSTAVLTESISLTLSLLGVYCTVKMLSPDSRRAAIAGGTCLGLAYLARPEALILTGMLAATVAIASRDGWQRGVGRALTFLGVFAVFALPYVAFLSAETGQLRWEGKSADGLRWATRTEAGETWGPIYFGIQSDLVETGNSNTSDLEQLLTTHVSALRRARILVRQGTANFPRLLRALGDPQLGQPFIAILVGLGLFGVAWSRDRLRRELPLLAVVALTLITFCGWPYFHDRFMFPLLPPLLVWAGAGLDRLRLWIRDTFAELSPRLASSKVLTAGFLSLAVLPICSASAVGTRYSDELSQGWSSLSDDVPVGRWLRFEGHSMRLMDTGPTVAYYAGAVLVPFPWCDGETALRYIDHKNISHVILRDSDRQRRPYLAEWLRQVPDGRLKLVKAFQSQSGQIRVYRWRPDA
jgi:4-amino-4-deoxy-L-arabinose transferase-like glycosyltransferase